MPLPPPPTMQCIHPDYPLCPQARPIQQLGLDPGLTQLLLSHNMLTALDVLCHSELDLMELLDLPLCDVQRLLLAVSAQVAPAYLTVRCGAAGARAGAMQWTEWMHMRPWLAARQLRATQTGSAAAAWANRPAELPHRGTTPKRLPMRTAAQATQLYAVTMTQSYHVPTSLPVGGLPCAACGARCARQSCTRACKHGPGPHRTLACRGVGGTRTYTCMPPPQQLMRTMRLWGLHRGWTRRCGEASQLAQSPSWCVGLHDCPAKNNAAHQ